ncbi:protein of unknown function [Streptomyces sp. KY70]|nr:protein of unknown function [Streptomyces sp. KY70]
MDLPAASARAAPRPPRLPAAPRRAALRRGPGSGRLAPYAPPPAGPRRLAVRVHTASGRAG